MNDCIDENHFQVIDGVITPQPWMQWRNVGSIVAPTRTASYGVTLGSGVGANVFGTLGALFGSMFSSLTGIFGLSSVLAGLAPSVSAAGNKNQLVHSLQRSWQNNTPIDQWAYGMITRGGCRVTLQARSRGGLVVRSGYRTQWQSRTDFDRSGTGLWVLGNRSALAEVADTKTLRLAGGTGGVAQSLIDNVPVGPGDRVRLTFRARRDATYNGTATNSKLRLVSQSAAGLASANFDTTVLASPDVWYDRSITYTVPASGVTSLRFQLVSDATAGNVYVDDIIIDIGRGELPDQDVKLTDSSMFGTGGDIGRGGAIAMGTDFAVVEQRMNSVTFPLKPEQAGWVKLPPGEIFTARAELRFISEFWENTTIDGGDSGTESSFESGDTRLDLYAVPVL